MRVFKIHIIQHLTATIFSLSLLFPSFIQFAHTFDDHKHELCTDISTHIHQQELDCSICDFHFSTFNFTPQQYPELAVTHGFQIAETYFQLSKFEKSTSYYYLRGPPQHS